MFSRKADQNETWNSRKGLRAGGWSAALASGSGLDYLRGHVGFYDDDPYSDLFFYNPSNGDRDIWFSDGSSDFDPGTIGDWSVTGYDIYPGHFNTDGLTDILRYRKSDGERGLFYSNGDGSFAARDPQYSTAWDAGYDLVAGDFDGDGDDDIFMYKSNGNRILKINDDGSGHFSEVTIGGTSWPSGALPFAGNFKSPAGVIDLGNYTPSDGKVRTYESNGSGSFSIIRTDTFETGRVPYVGWFNGDFLTDLILYKESNGDWTSRYSNGSSAWSSGESGDWGSARTLGVGDYQLS